MATKPREWDERDYKLWSELQQLPSYGLIGNSHYVSCAEVEKLLVRLAKERGERNGNQAGI